MIAAIVSLGLLYLLYRGFTQANHCICCVFVYLYLLRHLCHGSAHAAVFPE
jgi:hypothetical protein